MIITPLSSGQTKLYCPQATLFHLRGCIILPLGCLDLRSTASLRQDNAPLRWNNVPFGQYSFHCPLARGVILLQSRVDLSGEAPSRTKFQCERSYLWLTDELSTLGGEHSSPHLLLLFMMLVCLVGKPYVVLYFRAIPKTKVGYHSHAN